MSKKMYIFQQFILHYIVFRSVAISFRCAFLRGIECFLLRKKISDFAEATHEKRFMKIHDDDAFRYVTASQIASNSSLYILFQYEHHTIYLKSVLSSVSEKETNFSITPRTYLYLIPIIMIPNMHGLFDPFRNDKLTSNE